MRRETGSAASASSSTAVPRLFTEGRSSEKYAVTPEAEGSLVSMTPLTRADAIAAEADEVDELESPVAPILS